MGSLKRPGEKLSADSQDSTLSIPKRIAAGPGTIFIFFSIANWYINISIFNHCILKACVKILDMFGSNFFF